jgi:transposase
MIDLHGIHEVYLCREPTDMRKSIDGLSIVVEQEMDKNPFDRALFVFCNKKRDRLKVLYWNRTGFAVWFTRLEKERFFWPRKDDNEVVEITREQLRWLLEGYRHWRMKPHQKLRYEKVF